MANLWTRYIGTEYLADINVRVTVIIDIFYVYRYMASITKTDSPIRSQDVNNPLSSILSDHDNAALVLSYLKSNYTLLSNV